MSFLLLVEKDFAIVIIEDPAVDVFSGEQRQRAKAAFVRTRNKIIDLFDPEAFYPLPDSEDLINFERLSWRDVVRTLSSGGHLQRYEIKLAIGGALAKKGTIVRAVIGELILDRGFVPIDFVHIQGKDDKLSVMIDLLSYRLAKHIFESRFSTDTYEEQVEKIVDNFLENGSSS